VWIGGQCAEENQAVGRKSSAAQRCAARMDNAACQVFSQASRYYNGGYHATEFAQLIDSI
jgi:hypothetical protein